MQLRRERQQHRGARLEQVTELRQPLGEDDRFVMPGGVGELDDAHLAAGARAPFGARHHGAGDAAGAGARAHSARKLRPRLHPHALEGGGIIVTGHIFVRLC